ncbi:unnamed protein product [Ceutorhynchus assimilis]|uniref:Uncharacterized protein n=1 Tax=Ceutorhynchus assimilis TaxID=467358 RepID=A0A9N9MU96_9CUCU|nr:unnamed protein product [Ceutorhynchus assimilis]
MQYEIVQALTRFIFAVLLTSMVAVNAKASHFPENTQGLINDQDASANNLIDSGLRPWQLELIAQRMAELNQINQMSGPQDFAPGRFDRALRSGNEIKRQSRYRLCYFNPVSCFKK